MLQKNLNYFFIINFNNINCLSEPYSSKTKDKTNFSKYGSCLFINIFDELKNLKL